MRTRFLTVASVAIFAATAVLAQNGQGKGPGKGKGPVGGPALGWCVGTGAGAGQGGWWNMVTPKTDAQIQFVNQVKPIHESIRLLNREIMALKAQNKPTAEKEALVKGLQADLAKLTAANKALLAEMGVPAGMGVCDGTGPKGNCGMMGQGKGKGPGQGMGQGQGCRGGGQGMGMGRRGGGGTGTNPNCPFVAK